MTKIFDESSEIKNASGVAINPATSENQINGNQLTQLKSSVVSSASTTIPLGIAGVFTSPWIDTLNSSNITITMRSDVAGTLSIQRSSSGVSVGTSINIPYTRISTGVRNSISVGGRYLRIVYTNGGIAQTIFSLNTYLHSTATGFTFQPISQPQNDDTVSLCTLANLSGVRPDGTHGVVPLRSDDSLSVTSTPYIYAIAEGDVPDHSTQFKIGYSPASTAAQTTLWNPGTEYVFPTGVISVEAISSSVNDSFDGSGAKTVYLTYLDSNYVEKSFVFIMNGTTPVAGPTDFFRVNSFHVKTGAKSVGIISLRLVGGAGTIYGQMPAGSTRSRNSVFTVPIGKTFYIESIHFSAGYFTSGKVVRMTYHTSLCPIGTVSTTGTLFWPHFESMLVDGVAYDTSDAPIKLPEKTDMKVSVSGETNAQTTSRISGWIK